MATYVENAMFASAGPAFDFGHEQEQPADTTFSYSKVMHAHTLRQLSIAQNSASRRSSGSKGHAAPLGSGASVSSESSDAELDHVPSA